MPEDHAFIFSELQDDMPFPVSEVRILGKVLRSQYLRIAYFLSKFSAMPADRVEGIRMGVWASVFRKALIPSIKLSGSQQTFTPQEKGGRRTEEKEHQEEISFGISLLSSLGLCCTGRRHSQTGALFS